MKFLCLLAVASSATAWMLPAVAPQSSSLKHKRQTPGGGSTTLTPGGSSSGGSTVSSGGSGSGSSTLTPGNSAASGNLAYFNVTNFKASSNSRTASYSFNLAYWPGQPSILCESQETSWSGYFPYTEANCTNGASGSNIYNAFRIDPQADGSLDLYVASIYLDSIGYCSSCIEASNGTLSSDYISTSTSRGSTSQSYTGVTSFSLITYLLE